MRTYSARRAVGALEAGAESFLPAPAPSLALRPPADAAYSWPRRRPGRCDRRPTLRTPGPGAGPGDATSGRRCDLRPALRPPGPGVGPGEAAAGRRGVLLAPAPAQATRPAAGVASSWPRRRPGRGSRRWTRRASGPGAIPGAATSSQSGVLLAPALAQALPTPAGSARSWPRRRPRRCDLRPARRAPGLDAGPGTATSGRRGVLLAPAPAWAMRPPAGAARSWPRRRPGRCDLRPARRPPGPGAGLGAATSGRRSALLAPASASTMRFPAGWARSWRWPGRCDLRPAQRALGPGVGLDDAISGRVGALLAPASAQAMRPPAGSARSWPRRRPGRCDLRPARRPPGLGVDLGAATCGRRGVLLAPASAQAMRPPAGAARSWPRRRPGRCDLRAARRPPGPGVDLGDATSGRHGVLRTPAPARGMTHPTLRPPWVQTGMPKAGTQR